MQLDNESAFRNPHSAIRICDTHNNVPRSTSTPTEK
jgi:hypothetical protein